MVHRAASELDAARCARKLHAEAAHACRGGGVIKDVFLEQINVTNGGKNLIEDSELMLAHGRRYGLVGRNGTGKSTFLRALVSGEIRGLPKHAQVLHVEQGAVGDDTSVIQVCCSTVAVSCVHCAGSCAWDRMKPKKECTGGLYPYLSLIHISEPTRPY